MPKSRDCLHIISVNTQEYWLHIIFNLYHLHVGRPVFKRFFLYMPYYMRLRHLVSSALAFAPGVKGNLCGQSVNTAQEMTDHLFETHRVDSKKSRTANAGLGGVCPHCGSRLTSCIYRHLMSDFYRYACPVEGCNRTYSRPDQLRGHCKSHGFRIRSKANEDFAVRK